MPPAAIDACRMFDLLGLGTHGSHPPSRRLHVAVALRSAGGSPVSPSARPGEPGKIVKVPADLSGLIFSGVLTVCSPKNKQELDRYTHYAAVFRSDGEAMCLALAERRGWVVATDDRKAIRVARQTGLTVASCPQLVKAWAGATSPSRVVLKKVLQDVQASPNSSRIRPCPSTSGGSMNLPGRERPGCWPPVRIRGRINAAIAVRKRSLP